MASVAGIGRGGGGGGDLMRCCCGSGACRWPWGWNCGAARGVVDPERGGRGEGSRSRRDLRVASTHRFVRSSSCYGEAEEHGTGHRQSTKP